MGAGIFLRQRFRWTVGWTQLSGVICLTILVLLGNDWRCGNHPHPHKMRKLRPRLRPQRIWTARIQKYCTSVEKRKLRQHGPSFLPGKTQTMARVNCQTGDGGVVPGLVKWPGSPLELFRKVFGAVRAMFWALWVLFGSDFELNAKKLPKQQWCCSPQNPLNPWKKKWKRLKKARTFLIVKGIKAKDPKRQGTKK